MPLVFYIFPGTIFAFSFKIKLTYTYMKKLLVITAFTLALVFNAEAQDKEYGHMAHGVRWYTIEEAEILTKEEPRVILIDVYTDWCKWCKEMDKQTFSHPVIADLLNTKFYPVKFDAESKEPVTFTGYTFKNDGRTHQLAAALLQGQMSYPSVAYMTGKLELLFAVPGFYPPKDYEPLLHFILDKEYSTTDFESYKKSFQGKIK